MTFTKVAVVGAGGKLGKHFMQSLLASSEPKFQITVLARPTSGYTAPAEHVKVIKHDLTDHTALVESLRGVETLILMQGMDQDFVKLSKALIEAAIDAGVKMVMPSDYGGNGLPIQPQVQEFVLEKAKEGKITYTIVKNGSFFALPLKLSYGMDYDAKKVTFFGDGTQKFHATTYPTIADAIVSILRSPAQYANKEVFIHDFYTSQREILAIIESEVDSKFEATSTDLEELGKKSLEGLAKGEYNMENIIGAIKSAVWGNERCSDWDENDDSEALGLKKKDLRAEIKQKMQTGE